MTANMLGFDIALSGGRMAYRIPDASWDSLWGRVAQSARAAISPLPSDNAETVARWLRAMGPAYQDVRRDDVFGEVFRLGEEVAGVDLRMYQENLRAAWRAAWREWDGIRRDVRRAQD